MRGILNDPDFERSRYPDWETVIKALVRHRNFSPPPEKKVVIIIDEFPYLIARDGLRPPSSRGCGIRCSRRNR